MYHQSYLFRVIRVLYKSGCVIDVVISIAALRREGLDSVLSLNDESVNHLLRRAQQKSLLQSECLTVAVFARRDISLQQILYFFS